MNNQKIKFSTKLKNFLKRNSYSLVVAGCALVLAITLLVTATVSANLAKKESGGILPPEPENITGTIVPEENVQASNTVPIVFTYPVKNYTLGNTYSDESLVYNSTLNEYTTHLGVDFIVPDGAEVVSSFKGTIESILFDNLTGTTIIIDHGDGLKTSYGSLSSETSVTEGMTVEAGEVIGKASTSASAEHNLGAHVHFEVSENGTLVNPMTYLAEK